MRGALLAIAAALVALALAGPVPGNRAEAGAIVLAVNGLG